MERGGCRERLKHLAGLTDQARVIALVMALVCGVKADVVFWVASGCGTVEVKEVEEAGTFDLTVCAEWPQEGMTYVVYTPRMPQLSGMKILDHVPFGETMSSVSQTVQRIVHQFRLLVTNAAGTQVGTGPIVLQYRRGDQEERQERELAGVTLSVVKRGQRGVRGVVVGAVGAVVAGAGVLGLSGYWLRRRRGMATVAEEPCIECKYMAELEASKRLRMEGELGKYFLTLEQLLRDYLRVKYCIGNIEEWQGGGNERCGLDERSMGVAKELVGLAQQVRYAGYVPSTHEQRRMYEFIEGLLQRNQPRRQAPEEMMYLHKEKVV